MKLLDTTDLQSSTWKKIEGHYQKQLDKHRAALEDVGLSHDDAQVLRGQIKECRSILSHGTHREQKFRLNIQGGDEVVPTRPQGEL